MRMLVLSGFMRYLRLGFFRRNRWVASVLALFLAGSLLYGMAGSIRVLLHEYGACFDMVDLICICICFRNLELISICCMTRSAVRL